MKDFKNADLTITVQKAGNTITMTWLGQSVAKDPTSELSPYLQRVIAESAGSHLIIQYNQLEFMNSSSVKVILQFISGLNAAGITTTITYNAKVSWQRLSFEALKTFARRMEYVSIQGDEVAAR